MTHLLLCVLLAVPGAPAPEEKVDPLKKAVDLGPLGEFFEVVAVERTTDTTRGTTINLKLRATKEVDTGKLSFGVGFFDKDKELQQASPLTFGVAFPLEKGEAITATCWEGRTSQEWQRIAVRKVEAGTLPRTSTGTGAWGPGSGVPSGGRGGRGGQSNPPPPPSPN